MPGVPLPVCSSSYARWVHDDQDRRRVKSPNASHPAALAPPTSDSPCPFPSGTSLGVWKPRYVPIVTRRLTASAAGRNGISCRGEPVNADGLKGRQGDKCTCSVKKVTTIDFLIFHRVPSKRLWVSLAASLPLTRTASLLYLDFVPRGRRGHLDHSSGHRARDHLAGRSACPSHR